jgi:FkbM family methyltransferase
VVDEKCIATLAFQTDFQGALLEGLIDADDGVGRKQRARITAALSQVFVDAVTMLAPAAVLEVGSHEGAFSVSMKSALPSSRVIAFEAHPDIYAKYRATLAGHGVETVHACIAEASGTRTLHVPTRRGQQRLSMGSVLRDTDAKAFSSYDVPATTLDSFFAADRPPTCALWIDVEGAIDAVLDGSPKTLSSCVALYAELENKQRWAGQKLASDIIRKLGGHGLLPVFRDVQRPLWQYNLLFLRAGALRTAQLNRLKRRYARECCRAVLPRIRAAATAPAGSPTPTQTPSPAPSERSYSGLRFWRRKKE